MIRRRATTETLRVSFAEDVLTVSYEAGDHVVLAIVLHDPNRSTTLLSVEHAKEKEKGNGRIEASKEQVRDTMRLYFGGEG